MKEQFLNLTGLTELVGYLKTSIANHKEILPYASNKLFPSVGDINTIYIDTATNTIYRWDSSSKTYVTLAKAVKTVTISEATENGKISLTVDGNKTTVPIHGLGSAAYTEASAYSPANHTHTKAQIGLGNVDNTADANKSVKHATTADSATSAGTATNVASSGEGTDDVARHVWFSHSATETKRAYSDKFKYNPVTNNLTVNVTGNAATASSVAWGNVTGKPSTYAPSAHKHDDSTITSLNASKLFGTIDIARLPQGALERCVIVEDDDARFALTTANIQLGDTVKVNKTQKMYFVIDDSKLNSEAGYTVYTAGSATSVPWSGVTGKPTTFTPSSHTHPYLSALSVSGKTITYTKGDGTTGTITTQDTWRGIQNNLTSTSTTDSLSAAQGKTLKGLVDGKLSLSGGTMTGNISYKGSKATYEMIKFIDNPSDTYGNGIAIGGGGLTIIGGGESADTIKSTHTTGGDEQLILANDGAIDFYTNLQNGIDKATHVTIDNNGLYSGTAANANAAPWSGITGKPTTYPPSSHNHNIESLTNFGSRVYDASASRTKNTVLAAPNGSDGKATFRALVAADLPAHTHSYLPLAGGTMSGTAVITWPDSGNWSNSNKDVTFPVKRGGLSWIGQSDGIQLFAEETASDNLELILRFTDDNSNGLTIRNKDGTKTARISASGYISAAGFTGNLTGTADSANAAPWSGITGKPSTYPPSSHTHSYLPLAGGTMTGALNFANATWNIVGDDVYIGDMNVGGTLGVMGKNGNTAIKLVQYGASTTSGSGAPGVTWTCTGDGASTISGTLTGTFSGNLSGTASKATLLAPAYSSSTFTTTTSTWRNGITEGNVVWGQSWKDTSLSSDTGDLTIWIKKNGSVTTANMTIDGTINAVSGFIGSLSGNASTATALTTSAGSATQPVYFSGGKPVACTYTLAKSVPADAKFTDTNTWRGVQNNLTSTATDQSLSAAQGKALNEKKMGAVSANGYYGMARPDGDTSDWIRTTSPGIIPTQSGSRGSGHSALGTSSWYFSSSYIDHMYSTDVKIADKVLLQYDSTNACLNFVFS